MEFLLTSAVFCALLCTVYELFDGYLTRSKIKHILDLCNEVFGEHENVVFEENGEDKIAREK